MKKKNPLVRFIVGVLGDERRQSFSIPLFAIVLSLLASSIILIVMDVNPLNAFRSLLAGAGFLEKANYPAGKGMFTDFMGFLSALTPMIFAALSVAIAFKAGLFNIGVSGQMLFAGFFATILIGYSPLPAVVAKPLVILVGVAGGAIVGGVIGLLKHKFNINEVVSSIMLNYIIQYVFAFFILTKYVNPITRHSRGVSNASRLLLTNVSIGEYKTDLPFFIIAAIIIAIVLKYVLDRTKLGFEIKAVGSQQKTALYSGIKTGRNIVLAMVISGALAGLAGVTYYLGYYDSITPKALASTGFDAIAVSLLGNSNPIGILFASVLVTIVDRGATYMSSTVNIEREISQVITGIILLFSACGAYIKYLTNRARDEMETDKKISKKAEEER